MSERDCTSVAAPFPTIEDVDFRFVPNYPGYSVGSNGTVWSLWKRSAAGRGKPLPPVIGTTWKRLRDCSDRLGRRVVNLSCNGIRRQFKVHRLVLEAFVGPCPDGMEACHFPDRNPANNALGNLRWDTKSSNQNDRVIHGTSNRGERCASSKLTKEQVLEAVALYRSKTMSTEDIGRRFGIHPMHVPRLSRGERWQHLGLSNTGEA